MPRGRYTDPLSMDIRDDLERIDGVMTHILRDRTVWSEFLRDPNGMFVRLGLHPPTTFEINERVNRIFYATLTNKQVIQVLTKHYKRFRPSRQKQYRRQFDAGLRQGRIQNSIDLDLEAVQHLLGNIAVLRQVLRLTLRDLNNKGILQKHYSQKAIDNYIEGVIGAVRARQPIENHPKLEIWDRNYGIGQPFAGLFPEVGPVVTVIAGVEAGIIVTVLVKVKVDVDTDAKGPDADIGTIIANASEGDKEIIHALAILGRLLDLSGELLFHAYNFEKRFSY